MSGPLPLKRRTTKARSYDVLFGRAMLILTGILIIVASYIRVGGFLWDDHIIGWGTQHIFTVLRVLIAIVFLRMLAGWFRLVPLSWRKESVMKRGRS